MWFSGGLLEQWVASAMGGPVHPGSPSSTSDKHLLLDSVASILHSSGDRMPLEAPASTFPLGTPSVVGSLEQSHEPQLNVSNTEDAELGSDQLNLSWLSLVLSWHRLHVLADPALVVVMVFAVMVVTVMLELFHEVFAVFALQVS